MENTISLNSQEPTSLCSNRFGAVDIAKGILILAVVLSHAWFANSDILGRFFPYAMPAFFFLSGYTYKPGRGYFVNLKKRAVHLILPYILFGIVCNLLYPAYIALSKAIALPGAVGALWLAFIKADAINMLMATPMWFLTALFTGSVIFFAVADLTRDSLWKTAAACTVLIAAAVLISIFKKTNLVWYIDYAPFGAAIMLFGTWCGSKKLFSRLSISGIIIGICCLAAAMALNRFFPGSSKTSVVQYIEGGAWYGVLTAFAIAAAGSVGILCFSRLVDNVPVIRGIFKWLGKNSIWILCIHYAVIMLIELWLFNMHVLSNSIMQVVAVSIFGYGRVIDTPRDIIVKILVALFSIGISAIYALIHSRIKSILKVALRKKREKSESVAA